MKRDRRLSTARRSPALIALGLLLAACTIDEPPPDGAQTPPLPSAAAETATAAPADTPEAGGTAAATPAQASDDRPLGEAWEQLADAPLALTEVAATAHEGRVWVAGGFAADGSATDAVLVFDPAEQRWAEGPSLPGGVHHAALVSTEDRLYLLGGFAGAGFEQPTDEVWRLAEDGDRWESEAPLPEPRGAGAATWDGQRLVFGGGVGPNGVAADIYVMADDAWERLGQLSEPRQHLAATSDGAGRTWFLAGRHSSLETNTGRMELLDGSEIRLLDRELTPRSGIGAFWMESVGACALGGEAQAGTLPEVECVGDDEEIAELPPLTVPRHGLGVALLQDGAYAVLGGDEPGLFVSGVVERLPID